MRKSKILTTSDLYTKEKKPGKKPILTTLDLSDESIHQRLEESSLKTAITTTTKEGKKDE